MNKFSLAFIFCLVAFVACSAPTISGLTATRVAPIGLRIDYTISGAMDGDSDRPFSLVAKVGEKEYVAKNVTGETKCVNGVHRLYWNMAADGIDGNVSDATVTLSYNYVVMAGAKYCVIDLSAGANEGATYSVKYLTEEPEGGFNTDEYKTTKMVFRCIDADSFTMGGTSYEDNPIRTVTLSQPFYMGIFEVTKKQWALVMGEDVSSEEEKKPQVDVTYDTIRGEQVNGLWLIPTYYSWPTDGYTVRSGTYLWNLRARLPRKSDSDLRFDLPTEAQWECACGADGRPFWYGQKADANYMWYGENSASVTHEVGTTVGGANRLGLYDMHGNVWEWCLDWFGTITRGSPTDPKGASSGVSRVCRGGAYGNPGSECDSRYRGHCYPSNSKDDIGFRLSWTLPEGYIDGAKDIVATISNVSFFSSPDTLQNQVLIAPQDGSMMFMLPNSWLEEYYPGKDLAQWQTIVESDGLKTNETGRAMPIWCDYVAGTDPTNAASRMVAKINFTNNVPEVTWSPDMTGDGRRVYRIWGKKKLSDASWTEVGAGGEGNYRFFRVSVEMTP